MEGKRVILWQFLDWVYLWSQMEFPGLDIRQPLGHQENSLAVPGEGVMLFPSLFIEVYLLYNVVLASAVQQSESGTHFIMDFLPI